MSLTLCDEQRLRELLEKEAQLAAKDREIALLREYARQYHKHDGSPYKSCPCLAHSRLREQLGYKPEDLLFPAEPTEGKG